MTTIACNRKVIAFDSRESDDDICWPCDKKVVRIGPVLIGCAGDSLEISKFMDWFNYQAMKPPKLKEMQALVLAREGIYYYSNSTHRSVITRPFFAVGSGSGYAIGAMTMGAAPKRAVEIALDYDSNSGPPVRVMKL